MSKTMLVCVWLLSACASAGSGDTEPQDAAPLRTDGSSVAQHDAAIHDAPPSADAQMDQLPDANTGSGSGLFCTTNSDCTVSGECCVNLGGPGFCAPGTAITADICIPD